MKVSSNLPGPLPNTLNTCSRKPQFPDEIHSYCFLFKKCRSFGNYLFISTMLQLYCFAGTFCRTAPASLAYSRIDLCNA